MFDWLADPQAWVALSTLIALEVVLGIDNIIFISVLVGRLPEHQRERARIIGLSLAMVMRIGLLLSLAWLMRLTTPWFTVFEHAVTGRDLVLIIGGLFLLGKATLEMHDSLEGEGTANGAPVHAAFGATLVQIALIDVVFSLDSVITAVGMARHVPVMVIAIVVAVVVMLFTARGISAFIERHPTMKMLALSFLLLVGIALIADGLHFHIPKGYLYFAMAFSVFVEAMNIQVRKVGQPPIKLRNPRAPA